MLGHALVIFSDAHLGAAPRDVEEALVAFLEQVPTLGDSLLVNGDLFDFWFSYGSVIPRHGFHIAAELARLRRRVPIVMVGGNHDRWDHHFWRDDLGIGFASDRLRLRIGEREVLAVHGDGLTDERWSAIVLHRVICHPVTVAVYRSLHPDLGHRLVRRMAPSLGDKTTDEATIARAAERQRQWAEAALAADESLGAVVMGHTHRPALATPRPGQEYVNPGAWFDGYRYAVLTDRGTELRRFGR